MHQHIQAQLFLQLDYRSDFFTHTLLVVGVRKLAACVGGASLTNLSGLRERTNSGGGQRRQVQALGLGSFTLQVGLTGAVGVSQGGGAAADLGAYHARGGGALL